MPFVSLPLPRCLTLLERTATRFYLPRVPAHLRLHRTLVAALLVAALLASTALLYIPLAIASTRHAEIPQRDGEHYRTDAVWLRRGRPIVNGTLAHVGRLLRHPFAANVIVSEANRLMFCPVPKAASSNWKYFIRKIEGRADFALLPHAHHRNESGLRYLSDYSPTEARRMLADVRWFKFAFVRDPYIRLVSSYMDKMRNLDQAYTRAEYRIFVADAFSWRVARALQPLADARPSFRAFVNAVVTAPPVSMNQHWQPQHLLCGFGVMPYDFVGRMERFQTDVAYVLAKLNRSDEAFPTRRDLSFPPSGASLALAEMLYSTELMFKVRTVYARDFELLGYD